MLPYGLIQEAATRLEGKVRRTELIPSHHFSEQLGFPVYFKCENLQRTGSFKLRGALNFILCQPRFALEQGVITASAGNHGQGVAFAASLVGAPATVFMPENTPLQKIHAVKHYGAQIILTGKNFNEAYQAAQLRQRESKSLFIHPFENPLVIAGQGTIGLEILNEIPDLSAVVVPVGGGGLIAGVATAIKKTNANTRIIGVEAAAAPAVHFSLKKGQIMETPVESSLADGIAVKKPGENTFNIIRDLVDEVILVEEEDIAQAILLLLERSKLLVEGAGAVSLAALLKGKTGKQAGKTICLLSGGNIDVKTISRVVERGLLAGGRYLKLKIELEDIPGSLAKLAAEIAQVKANIFHINHDRRCISLPLGKTEIVLALETRGVEHIKTILDHLEEKGYEVSVLK